MKKIVLILIITIIAVSLPYGKQVVRLRGLEIEEFKPDSGRLFILLSNKYPSGENINKLLISLEDFSRDDLTSLDSRALVSFIKRGEAYNRSKAFNLIDLVGQGSYYDLMEVFMEDFLRDPASFIGDLYKNPQYLKDLAYGFSYLSIYEDEEDGLGRDLKKIFLSDLSREEKALGEKFIFEISSCIT